MPSPLSGIILFRNYMYFGYGTGILFSILFGKIYFATKAAEAKAAAKKAAALEGKKD